MRISDLARESGVAVATIKFYIREGLLPRGAPEGPTRALYGPEHLSRLRLIRALTEVGGLSLSTTMDILKASEDGVVEIHDIFGMAHRGLPSRSIQSQDSPSLDSATKEVDDYLRSRGWRVKPGAPARTDLGRALVALRGLGWDLGTEAFDVYAGAADEIAAWEISQLPLDAPLPRLIEAVVVGTVVFETVLTALRRLAEEHHSARRFRGNAPRN